MNELSRVATELDNSQTEYWLDLLHETKYLDDKMYESIHSGICKAVSRSEYSVFYAIRTAKSSHLAFWRYCDKRCA